MVWAVIVLSALALTVPGVLLKKAQLRSDHNSSVVRSYYFFSYTAGAAISAVVATQGGQWDTSAAYWQSGAVLAVGMVAGNELVARALNLGLLSIVQTILNANIVFPLVAIAALGIEPMTAGQAVLVGLILASIAALSFSPSISKRPDRSGCWVALAVAGSVLLAFRSGGLKFTELAGLDSVAVLFHAYTTASLLAFVMLMRKPAYRREMRGSATISGVAAGSIGIGGWMLYAWALAATAGSSVVIASVFPLHNAMALLAGRHLFGERLSLTQLAAIGVLVASVAGLAAL